MGADLYITKADEKKRRGGFEVSHEAVDNGYFRDCYNEAGLFALMSANLGVKLSWWITNRRKELFNRKGEMTVKGAKQFLSEIKPLVGQLEANRLDGKRFFYNHYIGGALKGKSEYKKEYFKTDEETNRLIEHATLLVRFIELAIEMKSTIYWSV